MHSHVNSIWFLIGLQLLIYGALITGTGIWELFYPPARVVDLAWMHPAIWWGAILVGLGLFYVIHYRPSRTISN
ncbi:MAG: hypothetical protein KGJ78_04225 [Alphaproteobacteria bacterium]|nr:hypothetical protein [Alphaproteobacteria bacterium]